MNTGSMSGMVRCGGAGKAAAAACARGRRRAGRLGWLGLVAWAALAYGDRAPAWPIYRGDGGLTGVARGALPAAPEIRWIFRAGGALRSAPVVADGRVYFGSPDGTVHALDERDGRPVWAFEAGAAIDAPVCYHDGRLFAATAGGIVYALSAEHGREQWRFRTGGPIVGSANAVRRRPGPDLIVVGSHDHAVHALAADTGAPVWTYTTAHFINATPAVSGNRVVVGGCDAQLHVIDAADGSGFAIAIGSFILGSAAVRGDWAFVGHYANQLVGVDLRRRTVVWTFDGGENGGPFPAGPAVNERVVVAGSRDRHVYAVDRQTGALRWRYRAGGRVEAPPVICGGTVLVGSDDGRVNLLDLEDGRLLWQFDVGRPVSTGAAVAGDRFYIAAGDGRLYAFGPP